MSKRIVLGVSGSIAAYKAADLASQLVKSGYEVFPILTREASRFIGPATFTAITDNPCPIDTFDEPTPGEIAHIWLGQNCDLVTIVPASMNTIAKLAHGLADNMLTATVLASNAPVIIAPAMNTVMWNNPATQRNLRTLGEHGYYFVEPTSGRLACRTEGVGKLAETEIIFNTIKTFLEGNAAWKGKRVLVTAGPTRESIDPVRYISNRSSGKMGYAIAEAARKRGAEVTLVTGPTALSYPALTEVVQVETAEQMYDAVTARADNQNIIICTAAVADYSVLPSAQKIKKSSGAPALILTETKDILAELGKRKKTNQILVGFAAETEYLIENAEKKLKSKNADWIVANDITEPGAGFESETNIVTLLGNHGERITLPQMSKLDVAENLLNLLVPV